MTFILSEDKALRNLLKGLTVTDQKADGGTGATRAVNVWFGQPDQEIRAQSYPYMTIDLIDVSEDFQRSMRGMVSPAYLPAPTTSPDGNGNYDPDTQAWWIHMPIPVNLDYQITTYSRQPRHDRELLSQLLHLKIPLRFAILEPDDGTVRRLDVLDISKRDVTEQGKRLFVNAITVRVSSEISPETYNQVYKALQVSVQGTEGVATPGSTHNPFVAINSFTIPPQ